MNNKKRASKRSSLFVLPNVGYYSAKCGEMNNLPPTSSEAGLSFFSPPHPFIFSVYEVLPSCTYIIEAIYNIGGIKDSFQFIKKANTERILEETK